MMNLTDIPSDPKALNDTALVTFIRAMESMGRELQSQQRLAFAKRQAGVVGDCERQLEALWPMLDAFRADRLRRLAGE